MTESFSILFGTDDLGIIPLHYFVEFRKFCATPDAPDFIERVDQSALNRFSVLILETVLKLLADFDDYEIHEMALRRSKILMQTFVNMSNKSARFRSTVSNHTVPHWMALLRLEPIRVEVLASMLCLARDMHKAFFAEDTYIQLLSDLATLWNKVSIPSEQRSWISALFAVLLEEEYLFLANCQSSMDRESFLDILFLTESLIEQSPFDSVSSKSITIEPSNICFCVDYFEMLDRQFSELSSEMLFRCHVSNNFQFDIGVRLLLLTDIISAAALRRPHYDDSLHMEQRAVRLICGMLKVLLEVEEIRRRDIEALKASASTKNQRHSEAGRRGSAEGGSTISLNRLISKENGDTGRSVKEKKSEGDVTRLPLTSDLSSGEDEDHERRSVHLDSSNSKPNENEEDKEQSSRVKSVATVKFPAEEPESLMEARQQLAGEGALHTSQQSHLAEVITLDEDSTSLSQDGSGGGGGASDFGGKSINSGRIRKSSSDANKNGADVLLSEFRPSSPKQRKLSDNLFEIAMEEKKAIEEDREESKSGRVSKSPNTIASVPPPAKSFITPAPPAASTDVTYLKCSNQFRLLLLKRQIQPHFAASLREVAIRAIGVLCTDSEANRRVAGTELNAISMLLRCATKPDVEKPLIPQWALLALKALCKDCHENQELLLSALELTGNVLDRTRLLNAIGLRPEVDEETGKIVRLEQVSPSASSSSSFGGGGEEDSADVEEDDDEDDEDEEGDDEDEEDEEEATEGGGAATSDVDSQLLKKRAFAILSAAMSDNKGRKDGRIMTNHGRRVAEGMAKLMDAGTELEEDDDYDDEDEDDDEDEEENGRSKCAVTSPQRTALMSRTITLGDRCHDRRGCNAAEAMEISDDDEENAKKKSLGGDAPASSSLPLKTRGANNEGGSSSFTSSDETGASTTSGGSSANGGAASHSFSLSSVVKRDGEGVEDVAFVAMTPPPPDPTNNYPTSTNVSSGGSSSSASSSSSLGFRLAASTSSSVVAGNNSNQQQLADVSPPPPPAPLVLSSTSSTSSGNNNIGTTSSNATATASAACLLSNAPSV